MNIRDLRYLVALAQHRHFGRAAAACFVSQPTLSTQIKKMEDELGVVLIERAPRKVLLTDAGREITERARNVLREVDEIKDFARRTRDPESGTLRIGLFPTLGPYLLPHIVPRIKARFPRLELLLVEDKSDVILRQLRDGRLDAAILALPIDDEQIEQDFLFEESFVLATHSGHRLSKQTKLSLKDIAGETLLLLDDGHCLRDQALDVCHLAGASEHAGFRATSLETLRQMVSTGVGITLLPALAVKPPIAHTSDLALIRFNKPEPSRRIALTWRRSNSNSEFLKKLAHEIRQLPKSLFESPAE